ncbi:uncharacterized protein LOC134541181 [Bacillus rossius redtenbacheri]|uniref:uncharacterized protein LOC134541181 n=1 Tax=Bacillus rossius redtenbacheri TaxID=93214 RepID=UPI002FDCF487
MDMRGTKRALCCLAAVLYLAVLYLLYDVTGDEEPPPDGVAFREELLAAWPHLNSSAATLRAWLEHTSRFFHRELRIDSQPYLVDTPGCRIPNHNPLDRSVWGVVRPLGRPPCGAEGERPQLTAVVPRRNGRRALVVDSRPQVLARHGVSPGDQLSCCYSAVTRVDGDADADNRYSISTCRYFQGESTLEEDTEFIYVRCFSRVIFSMEVEKYRAMHAIVSRKKDVRKRLKEYEKSRGAAGRRLSVLLLGIDSCSRLNLLRTMPRTSALLRGRGWLELRGYTKVGANTLPNFMALLAGLKGATSFGPCMPHARSPVDSCPFLWRELARRGYATALAEDEPRLGSFNHEKTGFSASPVDHYQRPFMLAAYDLLPARRHNGVLTPCLGHVPSTEYVLRYLEDFSARYSGQPFFGLFWLNNFSHEDPNDVAAADERFRRLFGDLEARGTLNETAVVFFSDHGTRFGAIRETSVGWFEDRMPFAHVWLPRWFRESHPEGARALEANGARLTSPFDLHATLEDLLGLDPGVSSGRSLLREVPENRTCRDAGVDDEWCTCVRHEPLPEGHPAGKEVAGFAVDRVRALLATRSSGECADLRLGGVRKLARRAEQGAEVFVVEFETLPGGGLFEATVWRSQEGLRLSGAVTRVNRYGDQSACTHDLAIKEFCYCV